jgi:alpha-galactosidase/6-phospho-beta-glucosidase family protein
LGPTGFNYEKYRQAAAAKEVAAAAHSTAPAPHPHFPNGRRPKSLLQCGHYMEMGRCPEVNCEYAHGEAEQREREAAWAEGERRAEAERRAAKKRAAKEKKRQAQGQKSAPAAALDLKVEFQGEGKAVEPEGGWAFKTAAAAVAGGGELAAQPARISEAAVRLMRRCGASSN